MKLKWMLLVGTLTLFSTLQARASTPTLQNLNTDQIDSVVENLGAALVFRPLEPASSYGRIFGFQVGVITNVTSISGIQDAIPSAGKLAYFPSADLFLGLSLPYSIGIEGGFLPVLSVGGAKIRRFAGNLKWTITDHIWKPLPFHMAVRAGYGTSRILFNESVSGVHDTVTFDSGVVQTQLLVSKKLLFFEPYGGLGYVHQSTTLSNTGTVTLFNQSVTQSNSFGKSSGSLLTTLGFQLHFFIPALSFEYDTLFGTHSYSVKLSLKF